jgi:predicted dehydrogenase
MQMTSSQPFAAERFQVGIVGAGKVVFDNHLPVLCALPDVNVAWVGDLNRERARSVAQAFGTEWVHLEHGAAQLPSADIVLLTAPYGARGTYYEAFRRSANVPALLVEKPFARSVREHREIIGPYAEHRIACGLNRRASKNVNEVAAIVREKLFGPLREVHAGLGGLGGHATGGRYNSDIRLAGGGVLFEIGVHIIDTVLFATEALGCAVHGGRMENDEGFDLHTEATLALELSDGASVPWHLTVSNLQDTISGIVFHFDDLTLRFNVFGAPEISVESRAGKGSYVISGVPSTAPTTPYQVLGVFWRDFLGGLRCQQANYTSAARSLLTTQVIEALYLL